jgi:hypothetical protein
VNVRVWEIDKAISNEFSTFERINDWADWDLVVKKATIAPFSHQQPWTPTAKVAHGLCWQPIEQQVFDGTALKSGR